jgi:streptomycin 6-kinase
MDYLSRYTIIDPKGVIGDPVFDISRFILNEFHD